MIGVISPNLNSFVTGTISLGGLYALAGASFTIIFKATSVVNFAVGQFIMLGAYFYFSLSSVIGVVPAIIVATVASSILGFFVYMLVLRRSFGGELFSIVILTFGLSILVQTAVSLIWGSSQLSINFGLSTNELHFLGFHISALDLSAFVCAIVGVGFIAFFLRYTRWGLSVRAVGEDPLLAGLFGVNIDFIGAIAWAISLAACTLTGIIYGSQTILTPQLSAIGFAVLPGVILGGMDSLPGTIVGGMAVGALVTGLSIFHGPIVGDFGGYVVLALVLLIIPQGLFGKREVRRV